MERTTLKQKLKNYEAEFKKVHSRNPTKADIAQNKEIGPPLRRTTPSYRQLILCSNSRAIQAIQSIKNHPPSNCSSPLQTRPRCPWTLQTLSTQDSHNSNRSKIMGTRIRPQFEISNRPTTRSFPYQIQSETLHPPPRSFPFHLLHFHYSLRQIHSVE